MAAKPAEFDRIETGPPRGPDHENHRHKGGKNALDPLAVKAGKRKIPRRALAQDDPRDQEAGNDEEDIDSGEASRQPERPLWKPSTDRTASARRPLMSGRKS